MKQLPIDPIVFLLLLLILISAFLLFRFFSYPGRIDFTAKAFSESTEPLQNPYCGFYHIIGYTLSDDALSNGFACASGSYTEPLVLLEINLKNYRTTEISEKGLAQLNDILAAWAGSAHGTRLILRFLYDWDGIAAATEPDSLELILTHMEQISKAVNRYRDCVYIMQGVFIGNWGEMHHSKFSDADSIKALIDRLNEVIDPAVYLSVRTPCWWRTVTGLCEPPEKFPLFGADNSLVGRLGLFNDGILGSESDLGTYGNTSRRNAVTPADPGTRNEELEFQNRLCRSVPNGGEVIYNHGLSELDTAVSALKAMHISYLNADYDSRVFDRWKNSVWRGNDAFNGCDGYSYIKAHLGYRYLINACEGKKSGLINPDFTLRLTLKNSGFSNTLKPFETTVALISEETGECIRVPLNADLKQLGWEKKKTFTVKLPVKEVPRGGYLIYFSVKDETSGQTVFLGNKNERTENGYLLGRLQK